MIKLVNQSKWNFYREFWHIGAQKFGQRKILGKEKFRIRTGTRNVRVCFSLYFSTPKKKFIVLLRQNRKLSQVFMMIEYHPLPRQKLQSNLTSARVAQKFRVVMVMLLTPTLSPQTLGKISGNSTKEYHSRQSKKVKAKSVTQKKGD